MRPLINYLFLSLCLFSFIANADVGSYGNAGVFIDRLIPASEVSKSDCIIRFDITELPENRLTRFIGEITFRKSGVLRNQIIFNEPFAVRITQQMRDRLRKLKKDVDSTYELRFCAEVDEPPIDACVECRFDSRKKTAQ